MIDNNPIKHRLNVRFGKFGALKYIGHLDLAKTWERVLRRANLPVLYSEGFNTRPRIQLASALPLGITSEGELLDVSLKEVIPLEGIAEQLQAVSPEGLKVYEVNEVSRFGRSLQGQVRSAEYNVRFSEPVTAELLNNAIQALFARGKIVIIKQHKRDAGLDILPLIYELHLQDTDTLFAHVATGDRGNVRIEDIMAEMKLDSFVPRIHRLRLHLEDD